MLYRFGQRFCNSVWNAVADGANQGSAGEGWNVEIRRQPLEDGYFGNGPVIISRHRGTTSRFFGALYDQLRTISSAELYVPQSPLVHAKVGRVEVQPLPTVAWDMYIRHAGHVFSQPPYRLGFQYNALELFEHLHTFPGGDVAARLGEILARWAANHALKSARWDTEAPDIAAKNQIWTTHDAKPGIFKATIQQANARKKRKNQHTVTPLRQMMPAW